MNYVKTKNFNFEDIQKNEFASGTVGQSARHHLAIYRRSLQKSKPTILELGTHRGKSTTAFLQVCRERGGRLFSVDIADCSAVSNDRNWRFIRNDSADVDDVLGKAPELRQGIDVLLIDTLHTRAHVEKEFYGWFPYLRKNAIVLFDDVDPFKYRQGGEKDNYKNEFDWEDIQEFVIEVFRANEDDMLLEIHFGSTGLAILEKVSDMGELPVRPHKMRYRTKSTIWQIKRKFANLRQSLM